MILINKNITFKVNKCNLSFFRFIIIYITSLLPNIFAYLFNDWYLSVKTNKLFGFVCSDVLAICIFFIKLNKI